VGAAENINIVTEKNKGYLKLALNCFTLLSASITTLLQSKISHPNLKITFISDTHGKHNELADMSGDMIIHAGDISSRGAKHEVIDFLDWFKDLDFKYKIFIAGNHDFYFEKALESEVRMLIPDGVTYLKDSGIEIEGIHIWGSPVQPEFFDWAFNRKRGAEIKGHWDLIPAKTDILITHGPPLSILDKTSRGLDVGCEELILVCERVSPKIHVFGHIHEAYGQLKQGGVHYINASVLDLKYRCVNEPIVLEYLS